MVKEKQGKNDLTETTVSFNEGVGSTWIMWEAGQMRKHLQRVEVAKIVCNEKKFAQY